MQKRTKKNAKERGEKNRGGKEGYVDNDLRGLRRHLFIYLSNISFK
jgi:hypothetical protein